MRLAITFLAVALLILVGASAYLLLQSCGLRLPFTDRVISVCETSDEVKLREEVDSTHRSNEDLELQITQLERRLGTLACKADPPPPPPPPPPPKPKTDSGLDPDAFKENDISVMEGCWQLSTKYDVRHVRTGVITSFRYWQICFDRNGVGRETMRATNGVTCSGPLRGRLSRNRLRISEPGNLKCSDGFEIFQREITCSLDARGTANCETYQRQGNGRGRATLRRERR